MDTKEEDVCGCLVFLNPNNPRSVNSSTYILRYGDVVRIGSKAGDDIRLKHLTDSKTDAVLISAEDTGFIQATNPEYAETVLNDSRLSAPKYLLPGDQLHIKGKIFMYDASFSAEDIAMLKAKNQDGSIRQVPKKRHSVMMYSIANSLKKNENEEFPIPESTVFVREGFEFQAEYLPSPVTPSKTNHIPTTPRMRKLSVTSEKPKTANNILAKRKKSLRRYSMNVSARSLGSPFLRLRKSHAPSPKQVLKALANEDLVTWTTPPMLSASLVARNSSPNLTTGRKSANITRWSNDSSDDDDDDENVVFVNSHRMSDYVYHGSFRESFVDCMGRKSRSSAVGRQSIMQNTDNGTIGEIEENDGDSVLLEASMTTGDKSRRSTASGRKSLVVDPGSTRRQSRTSTVSNMSMNKSMSIVEETPQVERLLTRIGRKAASPTFDKSGTSRSSFVRNLDGSFTNSSTVKSPTSNMSVSRQSLVNQTDPSEYDSDSFEDAEQPSALDESVPASGRKSGFQKSSESSELYEDDFEEPLTISERSMRLSQISAERRSANSTRRSGGDQTVEFDSEETSVLVSGGKRKSNTSQRSSLDEDDFIPVRFVRYPRSAPSKTLNDLKGQSPSRTSIGRESTPLANTRGANMDSSAVGRLSTISIRPTKSEILPSNKTGERLDFDQADSIGQSPTKHGKSAPSVSYSEESFDGRDRRSTRSQLSFALEEKVSTDRRPNLYQNVLSKTLNDNFKSPRPSVGRKSTIEKSGRISEIADVDIADVASPVVDRRPTMSRRSTRSVIEESNRSGNQEESLDSVFDEEVCLSTVASPVVNRRSGRSTIEQSNESRNEVEPTDESVLEEVSDRRPSRSQNALSKTLTIFDGKSPKTISIGRKSAPSKIARKSDKVASPVVDRRSTMSRRSTRSVIEESNRSGNQEESLDDLVFDEEVCLSTVASPVVNRRSGRSTIEQSNESRNEVEATGESVLEEISDRRPTRSQNALSNTLPNIDGQSPRNISIDRKSAPPKIAKIEIVDLDLSNAASSEESTYSRRATRSLVNPSDNTLEYDERSSDQEESPMKSAGSTASKKNKHSVLEIKESPDAASIMGSRGSGVRSNIGSQSRTGSTRRSTSYQLVEEQASSSTGISTRKSMRNQNETCNADQEEETPESPILSSVKIQRSSRSSSQSPLKARQLQESLLMGSPDLSPNKPARNGRSSLKLPQYDDVTMEEEDVDAEYDSDVFGDAEQPSALDESVPASGRKSGFQKSRETSEFYEDDFEEPSTISERSMHLSQISAERKSANSTRRSGRDQTVEFDPEDTTVLVSGGKQKSNRIEESQDFDQEDSFGQSPTKVGKSAPRFVRYPRSAPSKTLNDLKGQSPSRTSIGRESTPLANTRGANMDSSAVGRLSTISIRSTKSEILPSNKTGERLDSDQEDSIGQSPTKDGKSAPSVSYSEESFDERDRRSTRSQLSFALEEKVSTDRRPNLYQNVLSKTLNDNFKSPRPSVGRKSTIEKSGRISEIADVDIADVASPVVDRRSTMSRRSTRSVIEESNRSGNQEESQDDSVFEEEVYLSNVASPVVNRRSGRSIIEQSNESRDDVEATGKSVLEEVSDRRPRRSQNALSKTLTIFDGKSPNNISIGRKSAPSKIGRSEKILDILDLNLSNVASPVVDRSSTMSRRSAKSVVEQSNDSSSQVEPADESVLNISDRRPSRSQNALSKTLTDIDGQSPRNISIGRKSAPPKIARRSDKIMDILDLNFSNVASPVVDRSSTMSRRSATSVLEQSNDSSSQVEPVDESVLNVSDRRPSRSQNALSKTLTNIDGQSPRNISIGRKSAPPKIARSDKILEIPNLDLSNAGSSVVDRRSTYSRRATRSLVNPSFDTLEDDERSSDQEQSPMKLAGLTASTKTKHSVLKIQEIPDAASIMGSRGSPVPSSIGSQSTNGSTRRSTRFQLVEEQVSSSTGNSTRKSMRNQNKTCNADQEEHTPDSPILSSVKFQRSSRSSSQSPLKARQLQESILMGSPDLSANKSARNGRSSLKVPQYNDVTMEEEDVEAANDSDQENSEDEINISGIQRLQKSPNNDLTDVTGVKHLFTGPPKTPKLDGIKAIFNHERSPENDLTDIRGVKKLFTAKSPLNDLSNIAPGCVKEVFRADPYNSYSHVENLKDVFRRSPRNELTILGGVKQVFRANAPKDDLTNVYGVKAIFQNTGPRQVPDTPDLQEIKMFKTPKTLRKIGTASFAEKLDKEPTAPPKGTMPSNDSFDSLIGKPAYTTYKPKDIHGSPGGSRKIMNDSLSETFDSIKKKRKLAKTPRPIVNEELLNASRSREESEEAGQLLPRLSLDLFNAKRPEVNLDLEDTPGRIIENTSTPLPIRSSRTQSKLNLMASAEPKDESVAKNEKPTRSTRRNLTSNDTPQEDKAAPRTRRKLASTDTPEKPTRSQRGKKLEEVKETVKHKSSKPSRSRRNHAKEISVEEDTPKETKRNAKDNITSNDEDNEEPTEIPVDDVLPKRSSKRKIAEDHGDDSPLPATKTKWARGNDKKVDKVANDVTDDESAEEASVAEKPNRGKRNAKKVEKEEHILLPKDQSVQKSPVVAAKSTRGRPKKNLDKDEQETLISKDKPVQKEELKSPAVVAKRTRGRKNTKKNFDKDAQEAPISKDKPAQEEEHILLPKDETELKSPVAKSTRGRKNTKKNLDKDAQETPVSKDKPVQEEHIILPNEELELKSLAAKSTRGRPKKFIDKDAQETLVSKDKPVQEEEHIQLPIDESEQYSRAVAEKPTRGRRNAKKNLDTDKDEDTQEASTAKDQSVQETPVIEKKATRGRRNAKKVEESKPQRAKRNAKEIKSQISETDEDDVNEKKAGPQRTSRHVKFNDNIEEYEDESNVNEEQEKPTRGKRAASKKAKPVEPEDDADTIEVPEEAEEAVSGTKGRRGAKRPAKTAVKDKETAPAKKTSKRNQTEEVVEETIRKSKRLRK